MPAQKLVYQGPDPRALIDQVIEDHGPVRIRRPEKRRVGGVFGFFAREVYVLTVDLAGPDGTEGAVRAGEQAVPDESSRPDGSSGPAGRHAPVGQHRPARQHGSVDRPPTDPVGAYLDSTEDEVSIAGSRSDAAADARPFAEVLADVASTMGEAPGEYRPKPLPPRRAQATPASRAASPLDDERWAAVSGFLRRCGVPELRIQERPPSSPGRSTLESVFAGLPAAPPLPACRGGLVAIVGASTAGEGRLASLVGVAGALHRCAHDVATTLGCPRGELALVCEGVPDRAVPHGLLAQTPEEVASLAPGWRRDRSGVVTVHGPALGHDQRWTRAVLAAMRPSQVLAVASGTTKVEDVARWAEAVGGVDALVLVDAETTSTPAAILSAGIPVRSIDGEAATPARWARLVADRVATE